jgi:DNA-binding response OmpR family regulator
MLVTAATDEALPAQALEGGAVDVLIKPFRLHELLERIEQHLKPRFAARPLAGEPE